MTTKWHRKSEKTSIAEILPLPGPSPEMLALSHNLQELERRIQVAFYGDIAAGLTPKNDH